MNSPQKSSSFPTTVLLQNIPPNNIFSKTHKTIWAPTGVLSFQGGNRQHTYNTDMDSMQAKLRKQHIMHITLLAT
jgi:hypothetical protein